MLNKYKVLNKQEYHNGEYSLVPIRFDDKYEIMNWRNEQLYHLRQNKPLTSEAQDAYFSIVVAKLFIEENPDQVLFSYLQNGICIGYGGLVHINWVDRNAEISFIMNTKLEKDSFEFHWSSFLTLIEQVGFICLNFHKLFVYAFDLRPHLYMALEKNNFFYDARLKDHCFFEGEYKDVVIYSKIDG